MVHGVPAHNPTCTGNTPYETLDISHYLIGLVRLASTTHSHWGADAARSGIVLLAKGPPGASLWHHTGQRHCAARALILQQSLQHCHIVLTLYCGAVTQFLMPICHAVHALLYIQLRAIVGICSYRTPVSPTSHTVSPSSTRMPILAYVLSSNTSS